MVQYGFIVGTSAARWRRTSLPPPPAGARGDGAFVASWRDVNGDHRRCFPGSARQGDRLLDDGFALASILGVLLVFISEQTTLAYSVHRAGGRRNSAACARAFGMRARWHVG